MPKLNTEIKQQLATLSKEKLLEIVQKLATKKENFEFLMLNYLDKENGEKDLFIKAKDDLNGLFFKRYKGFAEELQLANMLSACTKRINEFTKLSKNKKLEADLLVFVLDEAFSYNSKMYGTCFTAFDYRVGLMVKRLVTILTKKIHEDLVLDYKGKANFYLSRLHATSDFLDSIYSLPKNI
ncbi:MAG: hypothetical protein WCK02_00545 [Bacteroidota bacterium]